MNGEAAARPQARQAGVLALTPRLLGVKDSARYLGIGATEVRGLIAAGQLVPVRPLVAGHVLRRVLVDVHQLDALVEAWGPR